MASGSRRAILAMAKSAMGHTLNGLPRAAAETLLSHGGQTRNAKLIQMAGLVTRRYQDKIDNSEPLLAAATELQAQGCKLGEPTTGSHPGGPFGRRAEPARLTSARTGVRVKI